MDGKEFLRIIDEAYDPFIRKFGFVRGGESINGRFCNVIFNRGECAISVTYELGEEEVFVSVYERTDGGLSDYDDRSRTVRLSDLNRTYMSSIGPEERAENESLFRLIRADDGEQVKLLKSAKELRLVLPRYLERRGL